MSSKGITHIHSAYTATKCCLGYVLYLDAKLVVSKQQVNFGEGLHSPLLVKEVIYTGQRVMILHIDLIKLPIINA